MTDTWAARTGVEYGGALRDLLPDGPAWPRDPSSYLQKWCAGNGLIWGDVDKSAAQLLTVDSDPRLRSRCYRIGNGISGCRIRALGSAADGGRAPGRTCCEDDDSGRPVDCLLYIACGLARLCRHDHGIFALHLRDLAVWRYAKSRRRLSLAVGRGDHSILLDRECRHRAIVMAALRRRPMRH